MNPLGKLAEFAVRRWQFTVLLFLMCLALGVASWFAIPRAEDPDFPVPIFSHWAWMWGLISWRDFRRTAKIANVLERDYQIKRALGFGPEHFTRIHGLLRPIAGAAASAI